MKILVGNPAGKIFQDLWVGLLQKEETQLDGQLLQRKDPKPLNEAANCWLSFLPISISMIDQFRWASNHRYK